MLGRRTSGLNTGRASAPARHARSLVVNVAARVTRGRPRSVPQQQAAPAQQYAAAPSPPAQATYQAQAAPAPQTKAPAAQAPGAVVSPEQLVTATIEQKWLFLQANPDAWWDNRENKRNPKAPDYKLKDKSVDVALWINSKDTPQWAKEYFALGPAAPPAEQYTPQQQQQQYTPQQPAAVATQQTMEPEQEGTHVFEPHYDDIKHLVDAPNPDKWHHMMNNADDWIDNRLQKTNDRQPDFKLKSQDVKAALWLDSKDTPDAAIEWLTGVARPNISDEELRQAPPDIKWAHYIYNRRGAYYDNRGRKLNPRAPDFTHKELKDENGRRNHSLWLDRAPQWVKEYLGIRPGEGGEGVDQDGGQPRTTPQYPSMAHLANASAEERWAAVRDSPNAWWDNRTNKRNPKAPDYKLKDKSVDVALWLSSKDTPQWAKEQFAVTQQ